MAKERDYKEEYRKYHSSPKAIKERSESNQARRKMGLKVGDPREVDHKKPLSKGGSNSKRNFCAVLQKPAICGLFEVLHIKTLTFRAEQRSSG